MLSKFMEILAAVNEGSLNPCFNGICSRRLLFILCSSQHKRVLILVLMEYALEAELLGGHPAAWES